MGEQPELKRCPFCNHNDVRRYAGHGGPKAKCMGCGASGISVKVWNTRPAPVAEVKPLQDAYRLGFVAAQERWPDLDGYHPEADPYWLASRDAILSALSPQPPQVTPEQAARLKVLADGLGAHASGMDLARITEMRLIIGAIAGGSDHE